MFPLLSRRTIKAPVLAMAGVISRILQSWFRINLCLCQSEIDHEPRTPIFHFRSSRSSIIQAA